MFALRSSPKPLVLYIHPGDIEQGKALISGMSIMDRTVQYFGTERGLRSFRAILSEFRLGAVSSVFSTYLDLVRERDERRN